jgi:hypothetical protein
MGEKYRITHTQTFFPESLILMYLAGLLARVLLFTFPSALANSGLQITTSILAYSCGYSPGIEPDSLLMFSDIEITTTIRVQK